MSVTIKQRSWQFCCLDHRGYFTNHCHYVEWKHWPSCLSDFYTSYTQHRLHRLPKAALVSAIVDQHEYWSLLSSVIFYKIFIFPESTTTPHLCSTVQILSAHNLSLSTKCQCADIDKNHGWLSHQPCSWWTTVCLSNRLTRPTLLPFGT